MITGRIIKAGKITIDKKTMTGFLVQCKEEDLKKLYEENLLETNVFIAKDRRGKDRASGPAFTRLPLVKSKTIGFNRQDEYSLS